MGLVVSAPLACTHMLHIPGYEPRGWQRKAARSMACMGRQAGQAERQSGAERVWMDDCKECECQCVLSQFATHFARVVHFRDGLHSAWDGGV